MEAGQAREVSAGHEAEVLIARERRNVAKSAAGEKDGERAEEQVEVLGVGDDGQKEEQSECVRPPEDAGGGAGVGDEKCRQIGDHQDEDQQGDQAGFPGELLSQPARADKEAPDRQGRDAHSTGGGKERGQVEVPAAHGSARREEAEAQRLGAMVERNQSEGAKGPENGGVSEAWQRALTNYLGLKKDFPYEVANARTDGKKVKIRVLFRGEDPAEHNGKATPEEGNRGGGQSEEEKYLSEGEAPGRGQMQGKRRHRHRTYNTRKPPGALPNLLVRTGCGRAQGSRCPMRLRLFW